MTFLSKLTGFFKRGERKGDLKANMEKALHMKQETGPEAHIPPHRTAREGMHPHPDPQASDAARGAEAGFTPQMKRSGVARSGDS